MKEEAQEARYAPPVRSALANWAPVIVTGLFGTIFTVAGFFASAARAELTGVWIAGVLIAQMITFAGVVVYQQRSFDQRLAVMQSAIESAASLQHTYPASLRAAHGLITRIRESETLSTLEFRRALRDFCTALADAVSTGVGHQVRVCVKQVGYGDDPTVLKDVWVETVARSKNSKGNKDIGIHHPLVGNTDFLELLEGSDDYWFSDDIFAIGPSYRNSSGEVDYHSVIVWPVRTLRRTDKSPAGTLVAYLCLDSPQQYAFREDAHVPLGQIAADTIAEAYDTVKNQEV